MQIATLIINYLCSSELIPKRKQFVAFGARQSNFSLDYFVNSFGRTHEVKIKIWKLLLIANATRISASQMLYDCVMHNQIYSLSCLETRHLGQFKALQ